MKLSDVMSALDLAVYAEVGLVLFLVAFVAVALDVLRGGRALESHAALPLEPESVATPSSKESKT
jgi:hypothetical protein